MELEMHPHHWAKRKPDWVAAIVAGLVAGAVAMVIDLLWTALLFGGNPWHTSYLVAAIVMGPDILQGPTQAFHLGVVTVALLTHYSLGMLFGVITAAIVTGFHYESSVPMLEIIGGVFGIALYLFNFHAMASFFPWVVELRSWAYLIEHLIFGMTAALVYWKLARRAKD